MESGKWHFFRYQHQRMDRQGKMRAGKTDIAKPMRGMGVGRVRDRASVPGGMHSAWFYAAQLAEEIWGPSKSRV